MRLKNLALLDITPESHARNGISVMSVDKKLEEQILSLCATTALDPLMFVNLAYEWGKGELSGSAGPRQWQRETFDLIGKHLQNKTTRFTPMKIAVSSGHGVGKSAMISMLTHWGMSTCVDCKVLITANTEKQLLTKTFPEVSKWFRLGVNKHWYKVTATAVASTSPDHERTWRTDAIPWSLTSTESFAGLHNQGKRIIIIFDEGSAIDDKIFEVVEGALTDSETEIIWVVFGNPTRGSGRFKDIFTRLKHRWITRHIDSRDVEGTNKEQLQQWVDDYGEDSDFVRVRVKGQFPRSGTMQWIPSDIVEAARKREPEANLYDPIILGCDIARFGDDETSLCIRRGRDAKSSEWVSLRGADTMEVAARIMELHSHYKFDAIFVDGGGVGGGVIDRLNMFKVPVVEVQFGGRADRAQVSQENQIKYSNKRAEMWGNMKDWLRGGSIPDDPDLAAELTAVEYGFVMRDGVDAILLEKKSDMKKRGLSSPDKSDSLALTFAYPVMPSNHTSSFETGAQNTHTSVYNPLSRDYISKDSGINRK